MQPPTANAHGSAAQLAADLAVHFDDLSLLELALTHRSWAFEQRNGANNERLELLGDAVVGLVVTDTIFHAHPEEQEGRLAKVRAAAVKAASLAAIARTIGLGRYIRLGRGEAASAGADKDSILADTLEAVIGAIYLDQGFATAFDVVERLFAQRLDSLANVTAALDFKTSLQELAAAAFGSLPRYEVTDAGPDHDKTFSAEVIVDGEVRGRGAGSSKKLAEQRAARQAYESLANHTPDTPPTADAPK